MNLSLKPGAGERAVLVKTEEGDSMILIGKWTGFVRGIPGSRSKHFFSFDRFFARFELQRYSI